LLWPVRINQRPDDFRLRQACDFIAHKPAVLSTEDVEAHVGRLLQHAIFARTIHQHQHHFTPHVRDQHQGSLTHDLALVVVAIGPTIGHDARGR